MRKLLLLSIICALAVSAFGQGSYIHDTALKVVNGVMAPIAKATITVCPANASGIPCLPAGTLIYSDAALTQPLLNPFTTDSFGNYQFAVASGTYTVTVTATGFTGFSYQVSTPSGSASSVTWSSLTGGTNSTQGFLIGTGASLGTSGTGTIQATSLPNVLTSFLPTNLPAGTLYTVTDASSFGGVCTTGGGTNKAVCYWDGSVWRPAGLADYGAWVNVKASQFGAKGDGTTDDYPAISAAIAALPNGGTVYLPPTPSSCYNMSQSIRPTSGITIQGAGIDSTYICNSGNSNPNNISVDIRGTVTGTTYAINAPSEGASTVTTTTAANAGNFAVGNLIAIEGGASGPDWQPLWITTVVSANATTGVITLAENLPRADFTSVQLVTSYPSNIIVRDLTIKQAANIGLFVKYARRIKVERIRIFPSSTNTIAGIDTDGVREATVTNCRVEQTTSAQVQPGSEFFGTLDSTMTSNVFEGAGINVDSGSQNNTVAFNTISDVPSSLPNSNFVTVNLGAQYNLFLGNRLVNIGAQQGVYANAGGLSAGGNLYLNNFFSSTGAANSQGITTSESNEIIGSNEFRNFNGGGSFGIVAQSATNIQILPNRFVNTNAYSLNPATTFVASPLFGQTAMTAPTVTGGINAAAGSVSVAAIGTPPAPTVVVNGTTGATSYTYFCVAKDINGNKTLASAGTTITNGNATLNSTNYNAVTCTGQNGAVSYDVLKTNTSTLLGNVAVNWIHNSAIYDVSSNSPTLNDTGQSTSAYTPASADQTGGITATGGTLTSPTFTSPTSTGTDSGTETLTNKSTSAGALTGTVASGTSALGTSAIAAGACATVVTTTATGTAATDAIEWSEATGAVTGYTSATGSGLVIHAVPTANNVNFYVCNPTAGSITPGALTLNWRVVR